MLFDSVLLSWFSSGNEYIFFKCLGALGGGVFFFGRAWPGFSFARLCRARSARVPMIISFSLKRICPVYFLVALMGCFSVSAPIPAAAGSFALPKLNEIGFPAVNTDSAVLLLGFPPLASIPLPVPVWPPVLFPPSALIGIPSLFHVKKKVRNF